MWLHFWHRLERCAIFHCIRLFRLRSATEQVARGFAVGMVVNFFPTFGVGMLASGILAKAAGGNVVAGFAGGAFLALLWPVLFYLNMRTGSLFVPPPIPVEQFEDVTEKSMNALVWGQTFTFGAVANSLLAGLAVYLLILLAYGRIRPPALAYFRRHARDHQGRLRRLKHSRARPAP